VDVSAVPRFPIRVRERYAAPSMLLGAVFLVLGSVAAPLAGLRQALPGQAEVAARAHDVTLGWDEFHALVLDRHAQTEVGRGALNHLLRAKVLDRLAHESKLTVTTADVDKKWNELEREIVKSGQAASLEEYLRKTRVGRERFREFLRLGVVQEVLARQALGIPTGRTVNGEQQEMWLDQVIQQRGAQLCPPPWQDGVAARCGDLQVKLADFRDHLVQQLTIDDVRDDCFQALLAKRARARMPDLSGEAYERAIDVEIERRRAAVQEDPKSKGVQFEQLLASQGLSLAALRRDPAVVGSALAHVWVDRTHGEDGLRRVYADERAWFDQRFGEARKLRLLFLRGALFKSDLNARTFADAERELERLRAEIKSAADFERVAKARSEDTGTRGRGGDIGFVSAGDDAVPESIRQVVFGGPQRDDEHCAGPVRIDNPAGAALIWVGERRAAPGWDEMRARVHNELRRRFLNECLEEKDVVTYLDGE
jgi:hypothetical protein